MRWRCRPEYLAVPEFRRAEATIIVSGRDDPVQAHLPGPLQLSHGAGIIALAILAWFAGNLSPLMLSMLTSAIMVVVAVWESVSLRSAQPKSEASQSEATSA